MCIDSLYLIKLMLKYVCIVVCIAGESQSGHWLYVNIQGVNATNNKYNKYISQKWWPVKDTKTQPIQNHNTQRSEKRVHVRVRCPCACACACAFVCVCGAVRCAVAPPVSSPLAPTAFWAGSFEEGAPSREMLSYFIVPSNRSEAALGHGSIRRT